MFKEKNNHEALFILFSIPVLMIILWYFGRGDFFNDNLKKFFSKSSISPLYPFFYFSIACVFLRTIIPIIIIKIFFRRDLFHFGYNPIGTFKLWYWYLIVFILVLPIIFFVSFLKGFQLKYPFCQEIIENNTLKLQHFLIYEIFYFLIFFSGESFWRGYVLFGLERVFGLYAIPIMVIPYSMSHFGKPYPEAFASIIAGSILGYLALQHRSFWLGVFVHWGAAIFMDAMAMWQNKVVIIR